MHWRYLVCQLYADTSVARRAILSENVLLKVGSTDLRHMLD